MKSAEETLDYSILKGGIQIRIGNWGAFITNDKIKELIEYASQKSKWYNFKEWIAQVKQEQNHYPIFKGKELDEVKLKLLFKLNKTPISALNDLMTLV